MIAMDVDLQAFVAESNRIEGINRPPSGRELEATEDFIKADALTIVRLKAFVKVCQPNARLRDKEGLDVRVGSHIAPRGGPQIVTMLEALLDRVNRRNGTPYELHCLYEMLHPFTDGNGRSGRAVWLWSMNGYAPLGFLHHWYYQSLGAHR